MTREPDSLDIGNNESQQLSNTMRPPSVAPASLMGALAQNPQQLMSIFGMTQKQAQNVSQILTGAGAGLGSIALQKMLAPHIGKRLAAAIGGGLGGYFTAALLEKLGGDDNGG